MITVKYPSEQVPAPAQVMLVVPDDWQVRFSSPATFAVVDTTVAEGNFRPNVVVTVARDPAGVTLDDAATAIDTYVESRRGFVSVSEARVTRDGTTWLRREYEVLGPSGEPDLRYMVASAVVDRGGCVDTVRLTGTCSHTDPEAVNATVAVVDSATIGPGQ